MGEGSLRWGKVSVEERGGVCFFSERCGRFLRRRVYCERVWGRQEERGSFRGRMGEGGKNGVRWVTYVRVGGEGAVLRTAQRRMPLPRLPAPRGRRGLAPSLHPNRRQGKSRGDAAEPFDRSRNWKDISDNFVNNLASKRFLCYIGFVNIENRKEGF